MPSAPCVHIPSKSIITSKEKSFLFRNEFCFQKNNNTQHKLRHQRLHIEPFGLNELVDCLPYEQRLSAQKDQKRWSFVDRKCKLWTAGYSVYRKHLQYERRAAALTDNPNSFWDHIDFDASMDKDRSFLIVF